MSLKDYNKMVIPDENGKNDVELEVNFSKNRRLKKFAQITIGKEKAVIPLKFLHEFILFTGTSEQQETLAQVKKKFVKKIIKSHVVQLNQTVKKGETVTIKCVTDVPELIYDEIKASFLADQEKSMVEKANN